MLTTKFLRTIALTLSFALMGITVSGCGPSSSASALEPDLARETLSVVLNGWKAGQAHDAWRAVDPEIVVQDLDWMSGAQLLNYKIIGPGEPRDANLVCEVELLLQRSGEPPVQRTVTYLVGTDPALTVFRAL